MKEVNELIKQLEIGEITIEQFLKKLESKPIKIKNNKKTNLINEIKKQIVKNNNESKNIYNRTSKIFWIKRCFNYSQN